MNEAPLSTTAYSAISPDPLKKGVDVKHEDSGLWASCQDRRRRGIPLQTNVN